VNGEARSQWMRLVFVRASTANMPRRPGRAGQMRWAARPRPKQAWAETNSTPQERRWGSARWRRHTGDRVAARGTQRQGLRRLRLVREIS
jgi:hypothetical protein